MGQIAGRGLITTVIARELKDQVARAVEKGAPPCRSPTGRGSSLYQQPQHPVLPPLGTPTPSAGPDAQRNERGHRRKPDSGPLGGQPRTQHSGLRGSVNYDSTTKQGQQQPVNPASLWRRTLSVPGRGTTGPKAASLQSCFPKGSRVPIPAESQEVTCTLSASVSLLLQSFSDG